MKNITFFFIISLLLSCTDKEDDVDVKISMNYMAPQLSCVDTLYEPYGICAHITKDVDYPYIDGILDLMDDLHITWVRSDIEWSKVSSVPGQMEYSFFDDAFSRIAKHPNVHLLPILTYYGNYPNTSNSSLQIKEYYGEWLSYLEGVVSRYSKYCNVWEGFNEWDYWLTSGYASYAEGLQFQSDIYNIVKEYNNNSIVLFTSMLSVGTAFKTMTKYYAQDYYDVANLHTYSTSAPEDNLILVSSQLSDLNKSYHIDKPLWITEFGYSTAEGYRTEQEQAYLIPRNYITGFSQGIDKMFLYSLRSREYDGHESDKESHFGIVHKDLSPKLAYYSVRNLIRMLPSGSTRPKLYNFGAIYLAEWTNPQLGKVYAIWTKEGNKTVKLEVQGNPHFYSYSDIDNALIIKDYDNVSIGPDILYITGATSISF